MLTTAKEIYRRKIGERKKKSEKKILTTVNAITSLKITQKAHLSCQPRKINLFLIKNKAKRSQKRKKKMMQKKI